MSPRGENAARVEYEPQPTRISRGRNAAESHTGSAYEPARVYVPDELGTVDRRISENWRPEPENEHVRLRTHTADAETEIHASARDEIRRMQEAGADLDDLAETYNQQLADLQEDNKGLPENKQGVLRLQMLVSEIRAAQQRLPIGRYRHAIEQYKECLQELAHATDQATKDRYKQQLRSWSEQLNALEPAVAEDQVEAALRHQNAAHYRETLRATLKDLDDRYDSLNEDESFLFDLTREKLHILEGHIEAAGARVADKESPAETSEAMPYTVEIEDDIADEQTTKQPESPVIETPHYTVEIEDNEVEETDDYRPEDTLVPVEEPVAAMEHVVVVPRREATIRIPAEPQINIASVAEGEALMATKKAERGNLANMLDVAVDILSVSGNKIAAWWNKDKEIDAVQRAIEEKRLQEGVEKLRELGQRAKENLERRGRVPFAVEKRANAQAAKKNERAKKAAQQAKTHVRANWKPLT